VQQVEELEVVKAPLCGDSEQRRWYADGGAACLVLTGQGELLEPFPTFGPCSYRLLVRAVSFPEANAFASKHGFPHLRDCPR
jgi:hypothetical protein